RRVTAEELRHRRELCQLRPLDAVVDRLATAVEQPARSLASCLHVREHPGDELVAPDRLAERLASLRILRGVVRRTLRDAESLRRDARPRAVEDAHRDREALALVAEAVLGGNEAAVEEDLAGRRALDPELRLDPPDLEPGRVRLDDERRDPLVARRTVRL